MPNLNFKSEEKKRLYIFGKGIKSKYDKIKVIKDIDHEKIED